MAHQYAKIDSVSSLYTGFKQIPRVQTFWNFHNIAIETSMIETLVKKSQKIFFNKLLKKNIQLTMEMAQARPIVSAIKLILR